MFKKNNILVIGAHADDVEIGCGGTIALHSKNGDRVYVIVMTEPFFTDYKGKVLRSQEGGYEETKNGIDILGAELINFHFESKNVPFSSESVEAINKVIDDYNIDTIYTHWIHDTHQDHMRTAQSVIAAGRYVKNILMYEPEYPAGRSYLGFRNQYYVDITNTFQIKMDALSKHESQITKYGKDKFMAAIEARARHRGYEIDSKYAECFEIIRLKGKI